jgi:glycosyltransferase involved in cell wall biosynthesis
MNDALPTVSVIIPSYNRAHLLGRSIRSVLGQTYRDLELIVVDDGSADNTEEVVRSLDDPRIVFLKHPKNRGASAARNTGIKASKGKFIAFQDSDDEWFPQKLEKQLALFHDDRTGDLGLVACAHTVITNRGERLYTRKGKGLNYDLLLTHFTGYGEATQRFLIKRDMVEDELYFDEKLTAWEEWDLLFRIARLCRIDYVNEPLVRYYRQGEPHLDVPRNRILAREALLRKYAKELAVNPKGLSYGHWQIALDYYKTGDMRQARYHLKKAVAASPRNLDYWLQYVAAVLGRLSFKLVFGIRHAASVLFFRGGTA